MAAKPSSTPRWAEESGGTQHNILEPASGRKDQGYVGGDPLVAQFLNWLLNTLYRWVLYLKDGVFTGEAGQPGLTVTGGSGAGGKGMVVTAGGTNENAVEAVPTGTGTALVGNAGATSGYGAALTGNATRAPLRIVPQSAQPSATDEGQEYYDSDDDKLYLYSNGSWQALGAVGTANTWSAAQTFDASAGSAQAVSITGNATKAPLRLVPQSFTPGTGPSSASDGDHFYNTQNKLPYAYRSGEWVAIGGWLPIVSKSAAYTATGSDHTILVDASGGAVTITLPAAAQVAGHILVVKKTDASGNAVTIDGNAAETIDGAATQSLAAQWDALELHCNGTSWFIIGIGP